MCTHMPAMEATIACVELTGSCGAGLGRWRTNKAEWTVKGWGWLNRMPISARDNQGCHSAALLLPSHPAGPAAPPAPAPSNTDQHQPARTVQYVAMIIQMPVPAKAHSMPAGVQGGPRGRMSERFDAVLGSWGYLVPTSVTSQRSACSAASNDVTLGAARRACTTHMPSRRGFLGSICVLAPGVLAVLGAPAHHYSQVPTTSHRMPGCLAGRRTG